MTRLLAALAYPLVVVARVLNALAGRDPLRLRRPAPGSLWIARGEPARQSYFSESSDVEGRGHGGFGWIAERILLAVAAASAHKRGATDARVAPASSREVPDEIYPLW
jgi:hypothetical protein